MRRPECVTDAYFRITDVSPEFKSGPKKELLVAVLQLVYEVGTKDGLEEAYRDMKQVNRR